MLKLLNCKNRAADFLLICLCHFSAEASAASFNWDKENKFQMHGFVSQSFIYTDKNNFLGESSENGSFDFTELALNFSYRAWDKFYVAGQLLSRRAGELDNGHLAIDFALIDYRYRDAVDYQLGIRAGRLKNALGFYNKTRDVPFTRPSIILPQSIYFDRTRDLAISSDGVQLYGYRNLDSGLLILELGLIMPLMDGRNTELAILSVDRAGSLSGELGSLARLVFNTSDQRLKVSLTDLFLNAAYNESGFVDNGKFQFRQTIFSVNLNRGNWDYSSEYARREISFDGMPVNYVPPFLSHTTGESYYFQTIYHADNFWSAYLRYDVLFQNKKDRRGEQYVIDFDLFAGTSMNKLLYSRFAKDKTLGVQWDTSHALMWRLELHVIDGIAWLPLQNNPNIGDAEQRWKILAASVSYKF